MTSLKGHARPLWSPHIGNRQISIIDSYLESHILTFSESESQISRLSIPHTLISALYILTSSGDDFCPKSVSITSVDGAYTQPVAKSTIGMTNTRPTTRTMHCEKARRGLTWNPYRLVSTLPLCLTVYRPTTSPPPPPASSPPPSETKAGPFMSKLVPSCVTYKSRCIG